MTIKELYEKACELGVEDKRAYLYNEEICQYYEVTEITTHKYKDGFEPVTIKADPWFGIDEEDIDYIP